MLRYLSTLICCYSLLRSYFIHLVTRCTTLAEAVVEFVALCDLNSSRNSSSVCQRARQVGVNDVGCCVLIGFADINKSRTCV